MLAPHQPRALVKSLRSFSTTEGGINAAEAVEEALRRVPDLLLRLRGEEMLLDAPWAAAAARKRQAVPAGFHFGEQRSRAPDSSCFQHVRELLALRLDLHVQVGEAAELRVVLVLLVGLHDGEVGERHVPEDLVGLLVLQKISVQGAACLDRRGLESVSELVGRSQDRFHGGVHCLRGRVELCADRCEAHMSCVLMIMCSPESLHRALFGKLSRQGVAHWLFQGRCSLRLFS